MKGFGHFGIPLTFLDFSLLYLMAHGLLEFAFLGVGKLGDVDIRLLLAERGIHGRVRA